MGGGRVLLDVEAGLGDDFDEEPLATATAAAGELHDDDNDNGKLPNTVALRSASSSSWLTFAFHYLNNVGAGFNLTVMGLVLESLSSTSSSAPTSEEKSLVAGAGFLGALSGQLVMGVLGDVMGRSAALVLTTLLIIAGSITSCALQPGTGFYLALAVARFVTCLGVGGVYPLTATSSSEEQTSLAPTLLVFSGQGVGQLLVPVVMYVLLVGSTSGEGVWRASLALGALPSLVGLSLFALHHHKRAGAVVAPLPVLPVLPSDLKQPSVLALVCQWGMLRAVLGTGLTWFLFDVTFYSNVVFAQEVVGRIALFAPSNASNTTSAANKLAAAAGPNSLVLLVGLLGFVFSYAFIDRLGLRRLQMLGFAVLAVLYGGLAVTFELLPGGVMFVLYACTFFFSNFGPNATTFCLPAKTFPKQVRSTFNGVSAGLGKLGAFTGIVLFPLLKREYNIEVVLACSSLVAVLGLLVTYVFVWPGESLDQPRGGAAASLAYELVHPSRGGAAVVPIPAVPRVVEEEEEGQDEEAAVKASNSNSSGNPFLALLSKDDDDEGNEGKPAAAATARSD